MTDNDPVVTTPEPCRTAVASSTTAAEKLSQIKRDAQDTWKAKQHFPADLTTHVAYYQARAALHQMLIDEQEQFRQYIKEGLYGITEDHLAGFQDYALTLTTQYPEMPLAAAIPSLSVRSNPFMGHANTDAPTVQPIQAEDASIWDTKAISIDVIPDFTGNDDVSIVTFIDAIDAHSRMCNWSDHATAQVALAKMKKDQ
ncbi:Hypothetical predicted protein, partial [Paramuricea clavata]